MNKRCWLAAGLLSAAHLAQAVEDSQAVSFARQAGVVAGAAQACGQPISLMTSRTDEVISVLATSPADVTAATGAYNRAVADSAASQTLSQRLTCNKVVTDFNNLPLLKPDYQQQVIEPLKKDSATTQTTATTTTAPAATPAAIPAPTATPTTMPVVNGQQAVPLQQVVTANTAPTMPVDNSTANAATPPNINTSNLTDAQRVQMAQKLTDMAASLLNSTQQPQFTNSYAQNVPQSINGVGADNPAFSNSLGVQPYPSGQTSNSAIAASADPGLQPYPTQSPAIAQSYPP